MEVGRWVVPGGKAGPSPSSEASNSEFETKVAVSSATETMPEAERMIEATWPRWVRGMTAPQPRPETTSQPTKRNSARPCSTLAPTRGTRTRGA